MSRALNIQAPDIAGVFFTRTPHDEHEQLETIQAEPGEAAGIRPDSTRRLTIAIDGPAGAGKSTVAKRLAARLGYLHIDTGAMYRAVTWLALHKNVAMEDEEALARLADDAQIVLMPAGRGHTRVLCNGQDITSAIRGQDVSSKVSLVARAEGVRAVLRERQREMARGGGVVMDGRDIGTVVLPGADRKFFLVASATERARRRQAELSAAGHEVRLEEIMAQLNERDRIDSEREASPLRMADDAVLIDSTGLSVDQVVEAMLSHLLETS